MEMREMEGLKAAIAKLKSECPDDQDSLKKLQFLLEMREQHVGPHEAGNRFLELFPDEVERMKTFVLKVEAAVLKEMEASVVERATGPIKRE